MKRNHMKNKINIYILMVSFILLMLITIILAAASRTGSMENLIAYTGSDSIAVTNGWKNTSGQDVSIQDLKYFNADGYTPYVFHRTLPKELPENMDFGFLTKDAGFAVFVADGSSEPLTQIDYDLVTEENNSVTTEFKTALNRFVYHNAEAYGLTEALSVYCGIGKGIGTKGTGNFLHTMDIGDYAGKEIYIALFPVYESSKISHLRLQNAQYFTQSMIRETIIGFVLSLVLVIMANAILTMSLFMDVISKKIYMPLGLLIMDVGFWSLLSSRTFDFVLGTSEFTNTMGFYLLMLVPIFGSIFLDTFTYRRHRSVAAIVCPVTIVYIIMAAVSNYAGWYDLYETKILTDLLIFIVSLVAVYLFIKDIHFRREYNFQKIHSITIINLIITMVCGLLDVARNLSIVMLDGAQDNAFFVRIGVSILCLGILLDIYSGYMSQHKKASLAVTFKDIAFLDELTGIGNRSAFARYEMDLEALIKELSAKADDSQSIIYASLDLNDLKYVNDNLGHAIGDVYIKTAARILRTSFHSANIYRVGGDEFSLFITGKDARADYEGGLKRMLRAQEEYNRTANSGIRMEFAYGVSEWRYFDMRTLHQLEVDADKAMYAKKREMKIERGTLDRR